MKKLIKIFYILTLLFTQLYSLEYKQKLAESDFYNAKFDKIVRYEALEEQEIFSDINSSKKLQKIILDIQKELSDPHASLELTIVGYSQHRASEKEALKASQKYVQSIYNKLIHNNIESSIIHTYAEGDRAMLYSDETPESSALSNRVNINLYIRYLKDEDKDGVYSDKDQCPNSKADEIVDENGCSAKEIVVLVKGKKSDAKIIVSNSAGSVTIDRFNELTMLSSDNIPPSSPKKISSKKIKKAFVNITSVAVVSKHYIFYFDDINLLQNSKKELNNMLAEIAKVKDPIIQIIGHTDTVGNKQYNYQLGLKRANEIKKFILKSKIKALSIEAISYGETNLAVATADNVDEKENRRVEVFIH